MNHREGRKRDAAALKWKINDGIIYAIEFGQAERVYMPETLRERILKVYHDSTKEIGIRTQDGKQRWQKSLSVTIGKDYRRM